MWNRIRILELETHGDDLVKFCHFTGEERGGQGGEGTLRGCRDCSGQRYDQNPLPWLIVQCSRTVFACYTSNRAPTFFLLLLYTAFVI